MSYEQIESWLLINPEFASLVIFIIGFFESFIIIGTFWPSIVLLLITVAMNETGISLKVILKCSSTTKSSFYQKIKSIKVFEI